MVENSVHRDGSLALRAGQLTHSDGTLHMGRGGVRRVRGVCGRGVRGERGWAWGTVLICSMISYIQMNSNYFISFHFHKN